VFVRETKGSDWFVLIVVNPELRKAALGYIHFNWCKSASHFTDADDAAVKCARPRLNKKSWS
jgi:hypothetical protein